MSDLLLHDPLSLLTMLTSSSICLRLMTYRRAHDARYKPWISACAWLLIVCSGGQALQIMLGHRVPVGTGPWQLGILLVLAVLVFAARGNLARVLRVKA
ncbi:phage holin family protein [Dyella silvatica]|uniref:phage holin family protein n=1 Tax=Dyella silvatica TaxID=2992128 RepID=UPI00225413F9